MIPRRGIDREMAVGKMDGIQITGAVLKHLSFLLPLFFTASFIHFQFTSWVDAVIFVFSLENETSFNAIYNYYAKMSQYRNMQDIPLILVGTQGEIMRCIRVTSNMSNTLATTLLFIEERFKNCK